MVCLRNPRRILLPKDHITHKKYFGASILPKPMMHIAYSPYFHKIYKLSPYFRKIYKFPPILWNLRFLNLCFLCSLYFNHDAFMHVVDAPGKRNWGKYNRCAGHMPEVPWPCTPLVKHLYCSPCSSELRRVRKPHWPITRVSVNTTMAVFASVKNSKTSRCFDVIALIILDPDVHASRPTGLHVRPRLELQLNTARDL